MKQMMFTLTTTVIFLTACNSEKKTNLDAEKRIVFTDTAALRLSNAATDKAASRELIAPEANQDNAKPKVVTIIKYVNAPQKQQAPKRSTNNRTQQAPVQQDNDQVYNEPSAEPSAGTSTSSGSGNNGGEVATTPEVKKKKGWSDAAKGATIGGVGGAVAGAVISKNKGKGAIIGGVVGAAGGYILGRRADKKSGRANYTQK